MKIKLLFFASLFLFSFSVSKAQDKVIAKFLQTGTDNATKLFDAFFGPTMEATATSFNEGWYNTAKAHGLGKFDFKIVIVGAFVPKNKQSYDANSLGLTSNVVVTNGGTSSPTFLSVEGKRQQIENSTNNSSFLVADGVGTNILPNACAQVTIGLPKNTEIMVRFFPKIKVDDLKTGMWGIGIKNELSKTLFSKYTAMPIDFAVGLAYTKSTSEYDVLLLPSDYGVTLGTSTLYDNQVLDFKTDAFNASALASKKLAVATFFAGVRYDYSKSTFLTEGTYPYSADGITIQDIQSPISIEKTFNQIALTGGLRLQFGFFALSAGGSLSKYSSAHVGIAFGRFGKD
jgi:hypothetical protein